jgi:trehalose 6-phosphate phosphatase
MEVVAVISGRPLSQLQQLIDVPEVRLIGLYGLDEGKGRERVLAALQDVRRSVASVPGAWVEDKGASLAVHYRTAPDPAAAEAILAPPLDELAGRFGLSVLRAKMAIELVAGPVPGKGAVIEEVAATSRLDGALFAGDDTADLGAFLALDRLVLAGMVAVKVAVRTEETPAELLGDAHIVVDRPAGLVRLLSDL